MQHMVFLNPRPGRTRRRVGVRRRHIFNRTKFSSWPMRRRRRSAASHRSIIIRGLPSKSKNMTRRTYRRRRSRVRRNPPKMTPALKRKIGARIRALHRAGKYKRRSSVARPSRRRRRRSMAATSYSPPRRFSRRRRAVGRRRSYRRRSSSAFRGLTIGGGALGLGALKSRHLWVTVGGAVGGTFVANYGCNLICPRLPNGWGNNPFVQALVKLASAAVVAKFVARWSRPAAQGILLGGALTVANDVIRIWLAPAVASTGTSQYLGGRGGMARYLGSNHAPSPGRNVRSLVGPVTPSASTFAPRSPGVGSLYGGAPAFKNDAWSR